MGLLSWLSGEKVLYYPGCLTKGVLEQEFENYKEIFNRLGIDFVLFSDDEVCCGLPVLNAGYRKDARNLAKKNLKLFHRKGITKIITSCPSCYHMFRDVYPKLVREFGRSADPKNGGGHIPVEHATVSILNALRKKKIQWKGEEKERELVAYHDPCHLGRYGGIYDEPREVVKLLGGKIIESKFSKENSFCCGAGGGVRANFEKLAKSAASKRVKTFSEDVKKIVSPCGLCYANLKSGSEKSVEFSSFVLGKLRGLR